MNEFEEILKPIAELMERKNRDYGKSFDALRAEYGEVAFLIRVSDKLSRLKSLTRQAALIEDESIEDTIKDIIGYCTLELAFRRRLK